jgi:hypothetical protein
MQVMVIQMNIRTYSELIKFNTLEERYNYLRLGGKVGEETFGFDRFINQYFYQRCNEWKEIRNHVIVRDNGCDLGLEDYEIKGLILVHHMNPISLEDIERKTDFLLNPEFLISTSLNTHNAIHYGDESRIKTAPIVRRKNDTCPWRH